MKKAIKDLAVILPILSIPLIFREFFVLSVATLSVIYSILAISWFFMERSAGWPSLAHSIPFGLAAYAVAINPLLFIPLFFLSVLIFTSLSIFGREKFAFTSFIAAVAFWYLSHYITVEVNGHLVGGEEGFSYQSIDAWSSYMLSTAVLLASLGLFALIENSGLGLKIKAVRDDETAAKSIGIHALRIRLLSFTISAGIASLAGVCYILHFGHVSPETFSMEVALFPFIASLIAGKRLFSPVLGSYAIILVSRAFSGLIPDFHLLIYAAALILSPKLKRWWDASAD